MERLGYVGKRALQIDLRVVARDSMAVKLVVDELLRVQVPLVIAQATAAPLAHRAAAGRIPVLFAFSGDPVEAGLVQSLGRPGSTTSGISFMALDLVGKRMEMLAEIAPALKRVAILANPQHPGEKSERKVSQIAADRLGLQVRYVEYGQNQGFESALDAIRRERCEGLVVFPDAGMLARASQIASFALQERLLCISGWANFAQAGCIASYGPSLRAGYLRLAHFTDRVLKGAHPANLPVELPTEIEMVINAKTARALGVTIPKAILLRADTVIS